MLLVFYSGIVKSITWGKKTVRPFWALLGVTYVVNIITTFTGCQPINHYWKVLPQTGKLTRSIRFQSED